MKTFSGSQLAILLEYSHTSISRAVKKAKKQKKSTIIIKGRKFYFRQKPSGKNPEFIELFMKDLSTKTTTLKDRFTLIRKNAKMTQLEVSSILGVTPPLYSRYESGKQAIPYETILKLATLFNISLDYLFLGKEINTAKIMLQVRDNTISNTSIENGFIVTTNKVQLSAVLDSI